MEGRLLKVQSLIVPQKYHNIHTLLLGYSVTISEKHCNRGLFLVALSSKEEVVDPEEIEHCAEHEVRVFRVGRVGRRQLALLEQFAAVRKPLGLTLRLFLTFTFSFFGLGRRPLPQRGVAVVILVIPSSPGKKRNFKVCMVKRVTQRGIKVV